MTEKHTFNSEHAQQAHDDLLKIGELVVNFAKVERATYYPNGQPENDNEHSFHLALSAIEMASAYHPELNTGLIAEFSLVHDLPEVYAGDIPTFNITPEARLAKEAAEQVATERLLKELPPYLAQLLKRYEEQVEPEARFVRFIDKLLPAIIHSVAADANKVVFKETYGMKTIEDIQAGRHERTALLQKMFPEFQFVHIVRELVSQTSRDRIYPKDK
jgi:putative hydrolase of HD superfamily